jgi:hypothetical protein
MTDHHTDHTHDHDHDADAYGADFRKNGCGCPLTFDDLAEALRFQANGCYAAEASVELLVDHGTWLRRNDFVRLINIAATYDHAALMAAVDWDAVHAANLAASSSEEQILALASELAGHDTNIVRVMQAVLSATGRHGHLPPNLLSWWD